ncbi:MAG TPA: threonine aldolase family protein [Gemmatimonadaceae bacterium]|nr:threonine aldolase family protein [Gemmatimonadaceae bacterium]
MPIDLRSDTVTKPTPAMRRAIADADVGDDVLDGDPTVKRLEQRVAELLGKEAALFFPSGTMANQTAVWLLSRPGTEVLLDAGAHILHYEMAGAAALAGVQVRPVTGAPVMDAAGLTATVRSPSKHVPSASLVCLENTHNGAGGLVTPLGEMRAIANVARAHALAVHLDGARLWNAAAASGESLATLASVADTVMVSFSKGLGCPIGAALAGSRDVIAEGWSVRKRFGGGMRQSGILAAAALYALDAHLPRISDDHATARLYASLVDGVAGARVVPPDTNIVMLDLPGSLEASAVVAEAARRDVLLTVWSPTRIRAVTHLDVGESAVRMAGSVVRQVLERMAGEGQGLRTPGQGPGAKGQGG